MTPRGTWHAWRTRNHLPLTHDARSASCSLYKVQGAPYTASTPLHDMGVDHGTIRYQGCSSSWKDFGKVGVAEVLNISTWFIIPVFWAGIIWLFVWFERKYL
jgi:hypothetical protein